MAQALHVLHGVDQAVLFFGKSAENGKRHGWGYSGTWARRPW
jgi:hypothetical protein